MNTYSVRTDSSHFKGKIKIFTRTHYNYLLDITNVTEISKTKKKSLRNLSREMSTPILKDIGQKSDISRQTELARISKGKRKEK